MDIENNIKILLNQNNIEFETKEIKNSILLLNAYIAGLKEEQFPIYDIDENNINKLIEKIPEQFHKIISVLSIKKSKYIERTNNADIYYILEKDIIFLLENLRCFFKKD